MFGKTRELHDDTHLDGHTVAEFFGDESAAAEAAEIDTLRERVVQVESQISSQFTSLATYAQIAQEQIELARAEAKTSTERSEKRVIELIERERADRIHATNVAPPAAEDDSITTRLDALEQSVAQIKSALDECFAQQLALAEAIARLFDARPPVSTTVVTQEPGTEPTPMAAMETVIERERPSMETAVPEGLAPPTGPECSVAPPRRDGAIPGLSLQLHVG